MEKTKVPLERLDKAIKLYGSNGFAAGKKMSWADLSIFYIYEHITKSNF